MNYLPAQRNTWPGSRGSNRVGGRDTTRVAVCFARTHCRSSIVRTKQWWSSLSRRPQDKAKARSSQGNYRMPIETQTVRSNPNPSLSSRPLNWRAFYSMIGRPGMPVNAAGGGEVTNPCGTSGWRQSSMSPIRRYKSWPMAFNTSLLPLGDGIKDQFAVNRENHSCRRRSSRPRR